MSAEHDLELPSQKDLDNINAVISSALKCFPELPRDIIFRHIRDIFNNSINKDILHNKLFQKLWIETESLTED